MKSIPKKYLYSINEITNCFKIGKRHGKKINIKEPIIIDCLLLNKQARKNYVICLFNNLSHYNLLNQVFYEAKLKEYFINFPLSSFSYLILSTISKPDKGDDIVISKVKLTNILDKTLINYSANYYFVDLKEQYSNTEIKIIKIKQTLGL